MALTCSLLGHAFDDYEVVREREERGSEVVTSIREVAVCDRCGIERVLSESTEVTSIVDEDDVETDPSDTADDDRFAPAADDTTTDSTNEDSTDEDLTDDSAADEVPDEGAELVENSETTPTVGGLDTTVEEIPDGEAGEEEATDSVDTEGDDDTAVAPEETSLGSEDDDAVILTDAPEEREYGEWPVHDDQQYRPWDPDTLLGGPDAEADEGPTVADVVGSNGRDDSDTEADDASEFEETAAVSDGEPTYRCPDCGFDSPATAVSLRPGDACPACRTGYLVAERNP